MPVMFDSVVSANVSPVGFSGAQYPVQLQSFGISMRTVTPGTGTLLVTIDYFDGDIAQSVNVAMGLTAGNALTNVWPELWTEQGSVPPIGDYNVSCTYLGAVSGTCQVRVVM